MKGPKDRFRAAPARVLLLPVALAAGAAILLTGVR